MDIFSAGAFNNCYSPLADFLAYLQVNGVVMGQVNTALAITDLTGPAATPPLRLNNGTAATGASRQDGLILSNGDLNMDGVARPNSGTAHKNRITPLSFLKAWALVDAQVANPTNAMLDGENMTSVIAHATQNYWTATMAQTMANALYGVVGNWNEYLEGVNASNAAFLNPGGSRTATTFRIYAHQQSGTAIIPAGAGYTGRFIIAVLGVQ